MKKTEDGGHIKENAGIRSLFLNLISPYKGDSLLQLSCNELMKLQEMASRHNLFALLCAQLNEQVTQDNREETDEFFKAQKPLYLKSIANAVRQEAVETEVMSILKKAGLPAMVIKGNAVARDIYGDPNCRSSADIDILVRRPDVFKADEVLKKMGYTCMERTPLGYCFDYLHHAVYTRTGMSSIVEMHWNFGVPYFFGLTSEDIWEKTIRMSSGEHRLLPEMQLILLLVHHHSHSFRELRILMDILWAFNRFKDDIDWNAFAGELEKLGLTKTALISLGQIQDLWNGKDNGMLRIKALEKDLKRRGNRIPEFLTKYFHMDLEREKPYSLYRDKFIARFVLDGWSRIVMSFLKTLLPSPAAVKALCGDHRNWTLPANYIKFMNWRIKEWTNPRKEHRAMKM